MDVRTKQIYLFLNFNGMKKLSLLAFALMLMVGTLVAQPGKCNHATYSPETRAMMRVDALVATVELSASERTQVLELFTKQEKEKDAKREALDAQREQRRAEMEASKAKTDASLKKIIGDEKFAKYEAARAEKKEAMKAKHEGKACCKDSKADGAGCAKPCAKQCTKK